MTNDEAIKLLMSMKDGIIHVFDGDRMIALEMAISALQAQDVPGTNDGDLISRRAAIEAAIKATDDWDGGYNITRANMIEKELNDLPSAQPEQRWTPVSERLPYIWDERYLVSLAWGGIGVMEYKSTGFHNYGSFTPVPIESITAWMPLPESYRGKEGEPK